MDKYFSLFIPIIPFWATALAIFALRPLSHKFGLLDKPGGRKEHDTTTPVIGGIAIFVGLLVGILFLGPAAIGGHFWALIVASLVMVMMGALDDCHDIPAFIRLLVQLFALSWMVFWGGVKLNHLGDLFGHGNIGLTHGWGAAMTLFGAATLVNAMNMIDGLDGLAGGISWIMLASLCGIALVSGFSQEALLLMVLLSAVLGFLCFNFPWTERTKASVFMGDAGSTLLGLLLAWFTIELSQKTHTIASPVIMLWIVAVPLMDLALVFIKRLKQGRSPFKPGNEHFYYTLMAKGLSRTQTTWVILGLTLFTQAIAWAMIRFHCPDYIALSAFLLSFLIFLIPNVVQSRPERR